MPTLSPAPATPPALRSVTFAMLKPDVLGSGAFLEILDLLRAHGFTIREALVRQLAPHQAAQFYREHAQRSFFADLVTQMSSGPVMALVLEHASADAIGAWRALLGATDPRTAADGTIRQRWGTAGPKNAAHGSDAPASAFHEIAFFFGVAVAQHYVGAPA